ncbi:DUF6157 family protein [Paenibacillus humicola]|uniref:DUF6157 family protein n=1 Tax=Paenibacillus humicola TaxID=3110540 RepID=UPI00237B05C5|nr:DUF6157 family protein [Paenibacillus humicola]
MEWNYYNTFITVSEDCPAEFGTVPSDRKSGKTKPGIEYELLAGRPYTFTQEELLYEVYLRHKEVPEEELSARGEQIREAFYRKPQPCLRASMLPKKYGWGLHFDAEGKIALYPRESPEYWSFTDGSRGSIRLLAAMRNSRKK